MGVVALAIILAVDLYVPGVSFGAGTAAVGPLIPAIRDSARRTAAVGLVAVATALVLGTPGSAHFSATHLVGVVLVAGAGVGSWLLAVRREAFEEELDATRTVVELGQRLGLAVEAAGLGTWRWDLVSGAVSWDRGIERLFGLPSGRFGGTFEDWIAAIHPEDRDGVRQAVADGMRAGTGWVVEHRVVHGDGSLRWIEGRGEPLHARDGSVVGATGIAIDVTERRARERRRADDQRVLEAALALVEGTGQPVGVTQVVNAACAAAKEVFAADLAAFVAVEGASLRLLQRDPPDERYPVGTTMPMSALPDVAEALAGLRPTPASVDDPAMSDVHRGLLEEAGLKGTVLVPLAAAGAAEAILTLGWSRTAAPVERLEAMSRFGDHVGWAVERSRRREAQSEASALSARLQAGLLPQPVLDRSGVGAVTAYRPGEARLLLGGDFFDAIGRRDGTVAFCIGDVSGHGPEEAALAAQTRAGWRALALATSEPSHWVADLDRLVEVSSVDAERFVTLCCGTIDPTHGVMTVVSAGHPPPVVLGHADGPQAVELPVGPPLGLASGRSWVACPVDLPEEWTVVTFTDGLVEGRVVPGGVERFGLDRLTDRLRADDVEPTTRFLDRLLDDVEASNGGRLDDDVAVVVLHPHGTPAVATADDVAQAATIELGANLDDVARARKFVRRTLDAWACDVAVDDVVLATSELVTNAVLHTGGRAWVRLAAVHGTVVVEVGDDRPPSDELLAWAAHPEGWTGTTGRGLVVVSQVAAAWGVRAEGDGKVVWFRVVASGGRASAVTVVDVRFLGVPARLLLAFEEHLESVVREARYVLRGRNAPLDVRGTMNADVDEVILRYDPLRSAVRRATRAAVESRSETVDALVPVPTALAEDLPAVFGLIEAFEALGARGDVLLLPADEELAAFRRWLVDELLAQVRGAAPTPCPFR